jgi:hypothetical protein
MPKYQDKTIGFPKLIAWGTNFSINMDQRRYTIQKSQILKAGAYPSNHHTYLPNQR